MNQVQEKSQVFPKRKFRSNYYFVLLTIIDILFTPRRSNETVALKKEYIKDQQI